MITTWESPVPRMDSRNLAFIYIDEARLSQRDGAFSVQDSSGSHEFPVASVAVLMLGPGVTITSKAVTLAAEMDVSIVWCGQDGVRFYASGSPETKSSSLLVQQSKLVSNVHARASVARAMYQMRFPDEDVSGLTIAQLRGKEGSRVKKIYKDLSHEYGVTWSRRTAQVEESNDSINLSLTMMTQCLYGVVHSVIESIGASPALGFVHTGHMKSFVFDIADLYKMELVAPLAFKMAKENPPNIELASRTVMRKEMHQAKLIKRIVTDIQELLQSKETDIKEEKVMLWDPELGEVPANMNWAEK